jgi:2-oxo-hept-3-ene-1,7-dioate hydratase
LEDISNLILLPNQSTVKNYLILFCTLFLLTVCKNADQKTIEEPAIKVDPMDMLANSILEARQSFKPTDLLSRELPNITRDQAFTFQLKMLEKELASGKKLVGYKMGGTAVSDSVSFNPAFGYILDSNVIDEDSTVWAENFPGGDVMVEAEIGFKISKDFPNGVSSTEELKAGIDYVFGAVEFAKAIAVPIGEDIETMNTNHAIASGTGQAGLIIGSGQASIGEFDMDNETVFCLINGETKAEGISSNIYGNPINALMSIANLLPKYGKFLKKSDVVITGSLYANPTINSTSDVLLKFSSLGEIHFSMK